MTDSMKAETLGRFGGADAFELRDVCESAWNKALGRDLSRVAP